MSDTAVLDEQPIVNLPPEEPSLPPGEWMKKNLFSSVGNTILTVLFTLLTIYAFRGVVNFAFENPERDWDAIRANLRLFFTFAYPIEQFARVWVSLGVVVSLVGLTAGLWPSDGFVSVKRIATWCFSAGALIAAAALMVKGPLLRDETGALVFNEELEATNGAWSSGLETRIWWFVVAALLLAIAAGLWFGFGERRRFTFVKTVYVIFFGIGFLIATMWFVRYGHFVGQPAEGQDYADRDSLVAFSTRMPWTVMWLLSGAMYFVGSALRQLGAVKAAVIGLWALAPFIIFWVILRDPAIDYDHVLSTDLPMYFAFAILGGAALYFLSSPTLGEVGRLLAFLLLVVAVMTFVSGFFGWFGMLQKARISFVMLAGFALIANNFAGDRATRTRFVAGWVAILAVLHYFITIINTPSTLALTSDMFLGGFMFSIFAAVFGLMFSFPLGVLLALARTSSLPIFRILATAFIEIVRGIPFITVLFFFSIMLPLFLPEGMEVAEIAAVLVGLVLFSAAYLAENVRGGLQSIRRGQYEAADAIGLTTAQRTSFIVLPQALRASIPPLVGQTIASYKETSLFAIIGIFDLLRVANNVVPNQSQPINFVGHKREGLLFVSLVYWVGSYAMSKYSQKLEKKLGVGER